MKLRSGISVRNMCPGACVIANDGCDAITAAWQSGIPGRARDLISRCHSTMEDLGDLEDETITLINDIIRGERQRAYA